jgi:hypothetical protein
MLKWGLWDQLEPEDIQRAWGHLCQDKRSDSQAAPPFSAFWVLMSIGRQLYLSWINGMSIIQIIDNIFLHGFMLGVLYARVERERLGIDLFTSGDTTDDHRDSEI